MDLLPIIEHLSPWAVLAVTLVGLLMLRWSLRQKRVGDHPTCRRCGYDLTGRPPGSGVCSECGASLSRRRAIRIGQRRMNRAFALAGVVLAIGGGWASYLRIQWIVRNDAYWEYEPAWLLSRQTGWSNQKIADGALDELIRRAKAGEISCTGRDRLVERIMERQRDPKAAWSQRYAGFIDGLYIFRVLPQEHLTRYSQNALVLSPNVRRRIKRGDMLPIQIQLISPREIRSFNFAIDDIGVTVGGISLKGCPRQPNAVFSGFSTLDESTRLTESEWQQVPAGNANVVITFDISTIDDDRSSIDPFNPREIKALTPQLRTHRKFVIPVEIVDGPSNPLVTKEDQETAMIAACRPIVINAIAHPRQEDRVVAVDIQRLPLPVPVDGVFNVTLRTESRSWKSFEFVGIRTSGKTVDRIYVEGSFYASHARKVEVVLTPSPEALSFGFDCSPIWGKEIVYKDVPVKWHHDASATTQSDQ